MALFAQAKQFFSVKTRRIFMVPSVMALSVACGLVVVPTMAWAGFQWVAPVERAPTQIIPDAPTPSEPNNAGSLPAPMQLPVAPTTSEPSVPSAPLVTPPTPILGTVPAPSTPDAAAPATSAEPVVEGFGRAMPLAIALKQVLPSGYGFALDGVDPNLKVSWEGGKIWYQVLDDMLTQAQLYGREEGQIIKITPAKVRSQVGEKDASGAAVAGQQEPPVIVPPMPVLENAQTEASPAPGAATAEAKEMPLSVEAKREVGAADGVLTANPKPAPARAATGPAASESTLPPIPSGELVVPNATMMPSALPSAAEVWHAEPGDRLHAVIKKWAERAHVELVWSTEYDYPIQASVNFSGSFEEAVRGLLTGFVEAKPQPYGRLHDNPAIGQRTLVIEARGNTNSD